MENKKPPLDPVSRAQIEQAWNEMKAMPEGKDKENQKNLIQEAISKMAEHVDMPIQSEGPIDTIAKGALHALNYSTGILQTPITVGAPLLAGQKEYALQNLKAAVNPLTKTPQATINEVAQMVGVPSGPNLSSAIPSIYAEPGSKHPFYQPEKGGLFDPTLRGAVATALDLGISPQAVMSLKNFLSKSESNLSAEALKNLKKVEPSKVSTAVSYAFDPFGSIQSDTGNKLYKSNFKEVDRLASKKGLPLTSDVLMKNNVWGGNRSIEEQANELQKTLGSKVGDLTSQATELNPNYSIPSNELTSNAMNNLGEQSLVGGRTSAANRVGEKIGNEMSSAYGEAGRPIAFNELLPLKQSMQEKAAAQRAYDLNRGLPMGRGENAAENSLRAKMLGQAYADIGESARNAIETGADIAKPGLGGQIYSTNQDLASLYTAQPELAKATRESLSKSINLHAPMVLTGSLLGAGGATYGGHAYLPYVAGGAIAGGIAASPAVRTGLGLLLNKTAPLSSDILRSYLMNQNAKNRIGSPWDFNKGDNQ